MSKKPIKEWGVVKFLTRKLPDIGGEIVGGLADVAMGESPVKVVRDRILGEAKKRDELTPEDLELIELQLDQALDMAKLQNEESANARQTEIDRYKYAENVVSRNMNTILACTVVLGYFILVAALMVFDDVGTNNQRLIDVAFGAIGASLMQIMNHYFGRSKREDDKDIKNQ